MEAMVALSFLYTLLKLSANINKAEKTLQMETVRHTRLHNMLANLEKEQVHYGAVTQDYSLDKTFKNSQPDNNLKIKPKQAALAGPAEIKLFTPVIKNATYAYNFNSAVHIGENTDVILIAGVVVVRFTTDKMLNEIWVRIAMKEMDKAANNTITETDLRLVKQSLSADSILNCMFRENPKPLLNDFGLPAYQRKLSILLSGSLKQPTIDGLIGWEEISGRPAWARIKIPIIAK